MKKCRPGVPSASKRSHMPAAYWTPISRAAATSPAAARTWSATASGNRAPDSTTICSSVRRLVIGMIPGMIGTWQPAAATRSRSRR